MEKWKRFSLIMCLANPFVLCILYLLKILISSSMKARATSIFVPPFFFLFSPESDALVNLKMNITWCPNPFLDNLMWNFQISPFQSVEDFMLLWCGYNWIFETKVIGMIFLPTTIPPGFNGLHDFISDAYSNSSLLPSWCCEFCWSEKHMLMCWCMLHVRWLTKSVWMYNEEGK